MFKTSTDKRKRIAIFTTDDRIWALPTWINTLPNLLQEHDVIGIYLFPDRLAKMRGIESYVWYLNVFGFWNFLVMGIYALKTRVKQLTSSIRSWKELSVKYGLQLNYASTPNSEVVIEWTKNNNIDIILIMVGNILKDDIINAPNIGIINKHAAILPSCKGLFPFFWGKLKNAPTGITFHQVDRGIDTGKILLQVPYPPRRSNISMLRFYIDVFSVYPQLSILAVNRLVCQKYIELKQNVESTYYSLPTKSDYKSFRKKSFKITSFTDVFYYPSLDFEQVTHEIRGN